MKFEIEVGHSGEKSSAWREVYDKPEIVSLGQAETWAKRTIERFNETLRVGEKPRDLICVVETQEKGGISPHRWEKQNLMTQMRGNRLFDVMKCSECGITGKRYGLAPSVNRDRDFKAKGFSSCAQSIVLLEKRRLKNYSER